MASGVKSKPVYTPLAADPSGRYHVLLGTEEGGACLGRVLRELRDAVPDSWQRTQVLYAAGPGPSSHRFVEPGFEAVLSFDSPVGLLAAAHAILDASLMGTRLYIAGPESFIGRALQLALRFNLNKDEIHAEHVGTTARRVHCVHCRASTEDVRTNIVRCVGCTRWLHVRDHYSRRFAAYMGVMADAEVPGELPPLQELYP